MKDQVSLFYDNPAYDAFVEKFKPKKTTDDCYTPELVYNAVADWVASEYEIDRAHFVRPFWPGGDYEAFDYSNGSVVVDNPPFSLSSQIRKWYAERGIKYFLFAPTLTLFSGYSEGVTFIPVGVIITYDNGAKVNTSFVTNMDEWQVRTVPELYNAVKTANDKNRMYTTEKRRKYEYPNEVITAAMVARWCKYGVDFSVKKNECVKISALDSQRELGEKIFGSGFMLGYRAAAERAAAERAVAERAAAQKWELSERERAICKILY